MARRRLALIASPPQRSDRAACYTCGGRRFRASAGLFDIRIRSCQAVQVPTYVGTAPTLPPLRASSLRSRSGCFGGVGFVPRLWGGPSRPKAGRGTRTLNPGFSAFSASLRSRAICRPQKRARRRPAPLHEKEHAGSAQVLSGEAQNAKFPNEACVTKAQERRMR